MECDKTVAPQSEARGYRNFFFLEKKCCYNIQQFSLFLAIIENVNVSHPVQK